MVLLFLQKIETVYFFTTIRTFCKNVISVKTDRLVDMILFCRNNHSLRDGNCNKKSNNHEMCLQRVCKNYFLHLISVEPIILAEMMIDVVMKVILKVNFGVDVIL